jgi:hypothetical protein
MRGTNCDIAFPEVRVRKLNRGEHIHLGPALIPNQTYLEEGGVAGHAQEAAVQTSVLAAGLAGDLVLFRNSGSCLFQI